MAQLKMDVVLGLMDRATAPLRGFRGQIQKTAKALREQQKELRNLNKVKMPETGPLTKQQMETRRQIELTNRAIDRHRAKLNRLNRYKGIQERGKAQMKTGGKMMAMATAAGYLGLKPIAAFAQNETAETDLKTAMMRAGGGVPAEFERINALANRLGDTLPGTTADMQMMMRELVLQGISFQSILGGTGEAAANMAVQMKMPFDETAKFVAKMVDATRSNESEMMGLMDSIQRGMHFGLDSNEMLNAVTAAAPSLSLTRKKGKEGMDEIMPLIVMAGQNELLGSSAGGAFSKIVSRSINQKRIGKANKELAGTGIKMDFTDKKGGFGGVENMIVELEKLEKLSKLGKITDQKRQAYLHALFGQQQQTDQLTAIIMDRGIAGYREVAQQMKDQASLQERVNAQLSTLTNLWDAAGGTFFNVMAQWGGLLSPELKGAVTWLTNVTSKIHAWSVKNPEAAKTIAKVTAATVLLTAGVGALVFSMGLLNKVFYANPIITALVLMGVLIWQIYDKWDSLVWFWQEGAGLMRQDIGNLIGDIPGVGNELQLVWDIVTGVVGAIATGFGTIGTWVKFAIDLFFDWEGSILKIKNAWDDFCMNWKRFWGDIGAWLQPKIDAVMQMMAPLIRVWEMIFGAENTPAMQGMYDELGLADKGISMDRFRELQQPKNEDELMRIINSPSQTVGISTQPTSDNRHYNVTQEVNLSVYAPTGNANDIATAATDAIKNINSTPLMGDKD